MRSTYYPGVLTNQEYLLSKFYCNGLYLVADNLL